MKWTGPGLTYCVDTISFKIMCRWVKILGVGQGGINTSKNSDIKLMKHTLDQNLEHMYNNIN